MLSNHKATFNYPKVLILPGNGEAADDDSAKVEWRQLLQGGCLKNKHGYIPAFYDARCARLP